MQVTLHDVKYHAFQLNFMGRKSKSEERKPEILEHFYRVLKKEGYAGATLDKIAKSMGVNSSLLVHYFKTKEEMMIALVDSITERYENYFLQKIDRFEDPIERLKAGLELVFSKEWTTVVDANVFYGPCLDLSFRNKRVMNSYRNMFKRLKEGIDRELALFARVTGKRNLDVTKTSGIVISLLEGFHIYSVFLDDKEFSRLSKNLISFAMDQINLSS